MQLLGLHGAFYIPHVHVCAVMIGPGCLSVPK